MRKKNLHLLLLMIACCVFIPTGAKAQSTYGYSSISYDSASNTITAYAETNPDYNTQAYYYNSYVSANIHDANGNVLASQNALGSVSFSLSGNGSASYNIASGHYMLLSYSQVNVYSVCGNQYYTHAYYDYYNYLNFTESPTPDYTFSLYLFSGHGPACYDPSPDVILGESTDSDSTTSPKPASLSIVSIDILPTGTSGDYGCAPSQNYGIKLKIKLQVVGDDGQPLRKANMRPEERVTKAVLNDQDVGDPSPDWIAIGPTRISGTSKYTDANGQFVDAPWGFCYPQPFTHSEIQEISIVMGNKRYPVRTNNISESSSASGAGSTSNGSDIQKSRP
jgi:hypothetical protein